MSGSIPVIVVALVGKKIKNARTATGIGLLILVTVTAGHCPNIFLSVGVETFVVYLGKKMNTAADNLEPTLQCPQCSGTRLVPLASLSINGASGDTGGQFYHCQSCGWKGHPNSIYPLSWWDRKGEAVMD